MNSCNCINKLFSAIGGTSDLHEEKCELISKTTESALSVEAHKNHNIVKNTALNKTFKYCKDCKEEV